MKPHIWPRLNCTQLPMKYMYISRSRNRSVRSVFSKWGSLTERCTGTLHHSPWTDIPNRPLLIRKDVGKQDRKCRSLMNSRTWWTAGAVSDVKCREITCITCTGTGIQFWEFCILRLWTTFAEPVVSSSVTVVPLQAGKITKVHFHRIIES